MLLLQLQKHKKTGGVLKTQQQNDAASDQSDELFAFHFSSTDKTLKMKALANALLVATSEAR